MQNELAITRWNVGRIAERIVANELEYRDFRVSDLNRDGLSANADLLAVGHDKIWQIQVKGATNKPSDKQWWWQYGYCTEEIIQKKEPMFNRRTSFYKAGIVILVAVRKPTEYKCIVLPVGAAERAAQINMDGFFRKPTRKGAPHKPGKVWSYLEPAPREHKLAVDVQRLRSNEREILCPYVDGWNILL